MTILQSSAALAVAASSRGAGNHSPFAPKPWRRHDTTEGPSKYDGQFVTAVFKLRPTRHKAAILNAVCSAATDAYWNMLDGEARLLAEQVLAKALAHDPSASSSKRRAQLFAQSFKPDRLRRFGLASEVEDGVHRDLLAQMSSYVELKLGETEIAYPAEPGPVDAVFLSCIAHVPRGIAEKLWWQILSEMQPAVAAMVRQAQERRSEVISKHRRSTRLGQTFPGATLRSVGLAGDQEREARRVIIRRLSTYIEEKLKERITAWPERPPSVEDSYAAGLNLLTESTCLADEKAGRDLVTRMERIPSPRPRPRPLTLTRCRACRILCNPGRGAYAVVLMLRKPSKGDRAAIIHAGLDACNGEAIKAGKSTRAVVLPLEMSSRDRDRYLHGRAALKSAQIIFRKGDWYMHAQFQLPMTTAKLSGAVLGIDRGIKRGLVTAVVASDGRILASQVIIGSEMADVIRTAQERNKRRQRQTARFNSAYRQRLDQVLHVAANQIVALAKSYGAVVCLEDLGGLQGVVVAKRGLGRPKNRWQKALRMVRMSEVGRVLDYKLKIAGVPATMAVQAAGSSITCPGCGAKDVANRPDPGQPFCCTACGLMADGDSNAAVIIARRGLLKQQGKIVRGSNLTDLHRNMVVSLNGYDDGGLGPLVADVASEVVAVRDAGSERIGGGALSPSKLHPSPGSEDNQRGENGAKAVLAVRTAPIFQKVGGRRTPLKQDGAS